MVISVGFLENFHEENVGMDRRNTKTVQSEASFTLGSDSVNYWQRGIGRSESLNTKGPSAVCTIEEVMNDDYS